MRDTALSIASGEGWTYRCDTVTELWPISFMIVNASAPVSPNLVPYVCRSRRTSVHSKVSTLGFGGPCQSGTWPLALLAAELPGLPKLTFRRYICGFRQHARFYGSTFWDAVPPDQPAARRALAKRYSGVPHRRRIRKRHHGLRNLQQLAGCLQALCHRPHECRAMFSASEQRGLSSGVERTETPETGLPGCRRCFKRTLPSGPLLVYFALQNNAVVASNDGNQPEKSKTE
jgi:hypothetical protein